MKRIKAWFTKTQTYILIIVIVYCAFVSIKTPAFLSIENIFDVLRSSTWMWILGMSVLVVIISGGIDLSFTYVAVCSGYTAAIVTRATGIEHIAFAMTVAIIVGLLFGGINGLLIHLFHLPSIFVTLGTRSIFLGLVATFMGVDGLNTSNISECYKTFGTARIFTITADDGTTTGLSVFIIPVIIFAALTWFMLNHTKTGRGVVALGNSETAAQRVGYNLFLIRMFVYMYAGLLASVAGVMAVAEVSFIAPMSNSMISGLELTVVAAVIIGGAKLSGGEGTVAGAFLGIFLVRLFETTMVFIGLTASWKNLFTGTVLLICLTLTSLQAHVRNRKMLLFEE